MGDCYSRKPAPGLLIEGWLTLCDAYPDEFYPPGLALMVGDRPEDEQCAARAGVEFMSAERWRAVPSG
jgi:phosphoglycolate phosphatase-like HAD superfamily hydrolase